MFVPLAVRGEPLRTDAIGHTFVFARHPPWMPFFSLRAHAAQSGQVAAMSIQQATTGPHR
jgi:hypothetical protein